MSDGGDSPSIEQSQGGFMSRRRLPSPAIAIAVLALFVSLSGTAVAAGVVPLAKRALSADKAKVSDNAKKLGGKTAAQLTTEAAAKAGPASSASALVATRTASFSLNPNEQREFQVACSAGEKAVSGGFTYDSPALVLSIDSLPSSDGAAWRIYLMNVSDDQAASGTLQAVCLR
jgi:hypothetical protein